MVGVIQTMPKKSKRRMKPKVSSMSTQYEITRYFEEMKCQDIAKKYQSQEDCIEREIKTSTGSRQRAQREHESEIYLEECKQKKIGK